MKKILVILFALVLIPLVTSQQIYPIETIVDLKVPCFNNETYCSPSSVCNVTILDFNGDAIIDNKPMTYNPAYHNFTLNKSDTLNSGDYRTSIVCLDNGLPGYTTFKFTLTPTGKAITTSSAILQGLILLLMFGVTIFFLIFATITDSPGVKLFFNIISYITMFLTIGTGYILLQSSEIQNNISGTMEALLFIVGIVLIVIMFYIFINQTRQALALMKAKRGFGSEYDNPPMF